jgi:hypothetical protein
MGTTRYIEPIEHAWRRCNPHAPLPPTLVQRAAPSGLALSLYHARLVAEGRPRSAFGTSIFTVATLPRISPPNEGVKEGGIAK